MSLKICLCSSEKWLRPTAGLAFAEGRGFFGLDGLENGLNRRLPIHLEGHLFGFEKI